MTKDEFQKAVQEIVDSANAQSSSILSDADVQKITVSLANMKQLAAQTGYLKAELERKRSLAGGEAVWNEAQAFRKTEAEAQLALQGFAECVSEIVRKGGEPAWNSLSELLQS